MKEKSIYIVYVDGDKTGRTITKGKEIVEDGELLKIYGMHNELLGAVRMDMVIIAVTTERNSDNE